jgi:acetylornithine deacetylase
LLNLVSGDDTRYVDWITRFAGHPLPAGNNVQNALAQTGAWCDAHRLIAGEPVDFWTEASIFSLHGIMAVVLGPGDIAQAHTTDEWLELAQLERATALYGSLMQTSRTGGRP